MRGGGLKWLVPSAPLRLVLGGEGVSDLSPLSPIEILKCTLLVCVGVTLVSITDGVCVVINLVYLRWEGGEKGAGLIIHN